MFDSTVRGALREPGDILLVSCYELGQQPLGLAMPAALLEAHGFTQRVLDLAVQSFDEHDAATARVVAFSVPMHTALRIGIGVAHRVRALNPSCHIVFFGLYSVLNAEHLLATVADVCLGAEPDHDLLELCQQLSRGESIERFLGPPAIVQKTDLRDANDVATPNRRLLPPIDRYVKLCVGGEHRHVGMVVTTHGCKHLCRHCPLPPVYGGRFRAIPAATVMADVRNLVAEGAQHISFGDPDFLNGPTHARRIAKAFHHEFPGVTFDFTAKVEHLLEHKSLVRELKELGCLFVVSAIESVSEATLAALQKGHTTGDVVDVIRFFDEIGLALRPTLVPFTPWA
jgi:radical SAM superfamily enzyme YgiQ (UPF0313 family)